MRSIFSAGVLDAFMRAGFYPFTAAYGVSAGASNIAAYLARMEGRNYKVYTDYMRRREFIRPMRFFLGGSYMDLDWLWRITKDELPLDEEAILSNPICYKITVTRGDTGEAEYLEPKKDDLIDLLKASSAIPMLYKTFVQIRGVHYLDGGIVDPIPVQKAWDDIAGAKDGNSGVITVLRSRSYSYRMPRKKSGPLAQWILRDRPVIHDALTRRPETYNRQVSFLRNPPEGCEIRELNPPEDLEIRRLSSDKTVLDRAYRAGIESGEKYMPEYPRDYRS